MGLHMACMAVQPLGKNGVTQLDDDEQLLWKTVAKSEQALDRSGTLYEDSTVTEYVNTVMQNLIGPEIQSAGLQISVKIVKNPLLNAFTFPNGVIYVHTGILASIENEAQLAALLGHELTHATHRHTIQELRGTRRSGAMLGAFQMVALPFGIFGAAASALGTVGHMAAVTGYSRSKEREADLEGLRLMVDAGYSPIEAPKLFEHLKRDLELRQVNEPFFFGTHPKLEERVESYHELIGDHYPSVKGEVGAERYQRTIIPLLRVNAETDLAMGRFALAEQSILRLLQQRPHDPEALFLWGEICRQRNGSGDIEGSEAHYRQAITADPRYPNAHKALGLILLRRGDRTAAKTELEQYLEYAPQAVDRKYIEAELATF